MRKGLGSLFGVLVMSMCLSSVLADTLPRISTITVYGNKVTKIWVIHNLLACSVGDTYNLSVLQRAKRNLINSDLFTQVDVIPQVLPDSVKLFVIVKEPLYISFDDLGFDINERRYGKNSRWWTARFGLVHSNFRGRMESLRLGFSFWESRSVSLSWGKTFTGTPWGTGAGISIYNIPFQSLPYHKSGGSERLSGSYLFPTQIRLNSAVGHSYYTATHRGSEADTGQQGGWHQEFNAGLGASYDMRNPRFNPHSGGSIGCGLTTNHVYAPSGYFRYEQFDIDGRGYVPIREAVVAFLGKVTLRNRNADTLKQLFAGGVGSIRGFSTDALPDSFIANNKVVLSCEYRFPLYTSPSITSPFVESIAPQYSDITFFVDGAVFMDAAHLWSSSDRTLYDNAMSIGTGLRVLFPNMKRSACLDFAVGRKKDWGLDFKKYPLSHYSWRSYAYVDMTF